MKNHENIKKFTNWPLIYFLKSSSLINLSSSIVSISKSGLKSSLVKSIYIKNMYNLPE